MPSHLGAVPADAHVAPAPSPRRRAVDEDLAATIVGTRAQPMRIVLGEEVGERAGDGGARLVEVVTHLRDRIAVLAGLGHELVVVQAVAEDVVQVANLLAGRGMAVVDAFRDGVHDVPKVLEAFQAPPSLGGVAPQSLSFHYPPALAQQAVLLEPREQGCRLGDVV